ncbi:MAG: hypothetical protein K9J27_09210 [Bacteroidales bacterium]|nr:hypothetical protein [Bacteroidales bacterium]
MKSWQIYITLRMSGVRLMYKEVKTLKDTGLDPQPIINALILFKRSGFQEDFHPLIEHWKTGGDPVNIVTGLIEASKHDIPLTLPEAIEKDKSGINIAKEIAKSVID